MYDFYDFYMSLLKLDLRQVFRKRISIYIFKIFKSTNLWQKILTNVFYLYSLLLGPKKWNNSSTLSKHHTINSEVAAVSSHGVVAIILILAQKVRILLRVSSLKRGCYPQGTVDFSKILHAFRVWILAQKIKIAVHVNFQKLIDISIAYQLKIDRLRIL